MKTTTPIFCIFCCTDAIYRVSTLNRDFRRDFERDFRRNFRRDFKRDFRRDFRRDKSRLYAFLLLPLFIFQACGQSKETKNTTVTKTETNRVKPENPYYSHTDTAKLNLTDAEWKKILPENLYQVSRHADTERPFTGKYWNTDEKGTYYCAACGNTLFRSGAKFASNCGWPSFFEQENKKSILFKNDNSIKMERIEALCGRCGGHLGHLFDDGPAPTGKRYCMNSIALDFLPDK